MSILPRSSAVAGLLFGDVDPGKARSTTVPLKVGK